MKRVTRTVKTGEVPRACDWDGDGREHGTALFSVTYDRPSCGDIDWMELCPMCFLERVHPEQLTVTSMRRGQPHDFSLSDVGDEDEDEIWYFPNDSWVSVVQAVELARKRRQIDEEESE